MRQKYSQTSTGIATGNTIFDRDSGKHLIIQAPSFNLIMSDSSLSFETDFHQLPPNKLMTLLKCLLILKSLSEAALEEAAEEIEGIAHFYSNRLPRTNLPVIPASSIKGKLKVTQVRPPIVLEP